ncbi:hypothetical protein SCOR_30845 [Sulfidibacter corallicola]
MTNKVGIANLWNRIYGAVWNVREKNQEAKKQGSQDGDRRDYAFWPLGVVFESSTQSISWIRNFLASW